MLNAIKDEGLETAVRRWNYFHTSSFILLSAIPSQGGPYPGLRPLPIHLPR